MAVADGYGQALLGGMPSAACCHNSEVRQGDERVTGRELRAGPLGTGLSSLPDADVHRLLCLLTSALDRPAR
jgi:hypothetical protein